MHFQIIGTDFAGPIYYRTKTKKESKAYILIFSCSVSRAVHLELIPNTTTKELVKCSKRLIARRGKPSTIYSDNAKSFQAAAKWLKQIIKSEQLHEHLTKENTKSTVVWRKFRKINWDDQTTTLQVFGKNKFMLERIRRSTARC